MFGEKLEKTLRTILDRLKEKNIGWMLAGSSNMAFQGINIVPRDLDVIVRFRDLKKIGEIFSDCEVSEIRELKPLIDKPAWELIMTIEGVEVQVLGEMDDGEYVRFLLSGKTVEMGEIVCFDSFLGYTPQFAAN